MVNLIKEKAELEINRLDETWGDIFNLFKENKKTTAEKQMLKAIGLDVIPYVKMPHPILDSELTKVYKSIISLFLKVDSCESCQKLQHLIAVIALCFEKLKDFQQSSN